MLNESHPKRKPNQLNGTIVHLLQLYKTVGDHEQLFSVPSAISFRNWSCSKICCGGHVWCQLESKVMSFISVSYLVIQNCLCYFVWLFHSLEFLWSLLRWERELGLAFWPSVKWEEKGKGTRTGDRRINWWSTNF